MIYNMDLVDWYRIIDGIQLEDMDYRLHYADGVPYVGLEFADAETMSYFIMKYVK